MSKAIRDITYVPDEFPLEATGLCQHGISESHQQGIQLILAGDREFGFHQLNSFLFRTKGRKQAHWLRPEGRLILVNCLGHIRWLG